MDAGMEGSPSRLEPEAQNFNHYSILDLSYRLHYLHRFHNSRLVSNKSCHLSNAHTDYLIQLAS